ARILGIGSVLRGGFDVLPMGVTTEVTEVGIERTILLHQHDDVLDGDVLVDGNIGSVRFSGHRSTPERASLPRARCALFARGTLDVAIPLGGDFSVAEEIVLVGGRVATAPQDEANRGQTKKN